MLILRHRNTFKLTPELFLFQIPHLRLTPWRVILLIHSSQKAYRLPWMWVRAPLTHRLMRGRNQSSRHKLEPPPHAEAPKTPPPGPGSNQLHSVNKRDESPYPEGIYILVEGTDNSKNKLVEY